MFGAVAAGKAAGGYDSIYAAAQKMAHLKDETFKPIPKNRIVYEKLFSEYLRLHDYFGRGANNVMKTLKQIKFEAKNAK
jgi:L-ribulokinase